MRFLLVFFLLLSCIEAKELKDVSVQLKWEHNLEYIGFYMAIEKGYYKDIGLKVHFVKNAESIDKNANYKVLRSASLIDISKGNDLVYLFAVFQSNPLILLADKSSGIKTLKDIKNGTIMANKSHLLDASLFALLSLQKIDINDVKLVKPTYNVKDLLDKKVDLMAAFITNEPYVLEELGGTPVIFDSKDYGFDFYNDIVAVNRSYLNKNLREVSDFRKATLKGYRYAFSHPEKSVNLIYNKYNSLKKTKKLLTHEIEELKKLAYFETDNLGIITKEKLAKNYYTYKLLGLIKNNINIENIIFKNVPEDIKLNEDEVRYLQKKDTIKVCADPNWLPFDKLDENGRYIGISADYIRLISEFLKTKMVYVATSSWAEALEFAKTRKCDIITSAVSTKAREKYLNFTDPYAKFTIVMATKAKVPFINDLSDLEGKKIGAVKGSVAARELKKDVPNVKIVDIKNTESGLKKVSLGKIFALIDTLPAIAFNLQKSGYQNIKISGKAYESWDAKIGVRNDDKMLFDILQKAVHSITPRQKQTIFNDWLSVKYENAVDYDLIKKIVFIALIVIIFLFLWIKKINSLHKQLKIANEKLSHLAKTDKLTSVYNRVKLDEILAKELDRSKRYKSSFGVCILDIDKFKLVNDTYGHQVGDGVLKQFADILTMHVRKTDYVGRWGGEEFLIICLQMDESSFLKLIEKIRIFISKHKFLEQKDITASFGITIYKENDTAETIVKRADDALYEAKENGRNRVVVGKSS